MNMEGSKNEIDSFPRWGIDSYLRREVNTNYLRCLTAAICAFLTHVDNLRIALSSVGVLRDHCSCFARLGPLVQWYSQYHLPPLIYCGGGGEGGVFRRRLCRFFFPVRCCLGLLRLWNEDAMRGGKKLSRGRFIHSTSVSKYRGGRTRSIRKR